MKIVFSDKKTGRSAQMELTVDKVTELLNKKIGDTVDGSFMGLTGYTFKIAGGSDRSGFPMERSMEGTGKVKIFKEIASSGKQKGQYRRESKRGNMISADIEQINLVILEYGDKSPEELFPAKAGKADAAAPAGEKKEAKAEKKEEKKAEAKA
jgi:small subunit ribosomal protein S6e